MWILIDNYDSFSYMLLHYLQEIHPDVIVFRNDECSIEQLKALQPERIIISPGPKRPIDSGIARQVIEAFYKSTPLLGVCLGHQALGEQYGARLDKAPQPRHGKVSPIEIVNDHPVFEGIETGSSVMRYHSLGLNGWEQTEMIPLAFADDGVLMAFSHQVYPSVGLQFHPESILTKDGMKMLSNWAAMSFEQ